VFIRSSRALLLLLVVFLGLVVDCSLALFVVRAR
jgi:hypothetical protein